MPVTGWRIPADVIINRAVYRLRIRSMDKTTEESQKEGGLRDQVLIYERAEGAKLRIKGYRRHGAHATKIEKTNRGIYGRSRYTARFVVVVIYTARLTESQPRPHAFQSFLLFFYRTSLSV